MPTIVTGIVSTRMCNPRGEFYIIEIQICYSLGTRYVLFDSKEQCFCPLKLLNSLNSIGLEKDCIQVQLHQIFFKAITPTPMATSGAKYS